MTLEELYQHILNKVLNKEIIKKTGDIDCIINPSAHPLVLQNSDCKCESNQENCIKACLFNAITKNENGNIVIDKKNCVGCAECINVCKGKNLIQNRDTVAVLDLLFNTDSDVYLIIAPAYVGQFGSNATLDKLRTFFKQLGFCGVVEVALFADILTLKEALEFTHKVSKKEDYILASCCCPVWINMIKKNFSSLLPKLNGAVSPMIACAKSIKALNANAKVVFLSPCLAKKAEARENDIANIVDYVLTFKEMQEVFDILNVDFSKLASDYKEHSSACGKGYAKSGGVSTAFLTALKTFDFTPNFEVTTIVKDSIPECKKLLEQLCNGDVKANFIEGMGCKGGCIGGTKVIANSNETLGILNETISNSEFQSPIENPYVIKMLNQLGYSSVNDFLFNDTHFMRDLNI